jgi:small subunit ribosomal protein S9
MATTINKNYFYGTGRRKTAVARVRLLPGTGTVTVNNKTLNEYFGGRQLHEIVITSPLRQVGRIGQFNVTVRVVGGGTTGQAGAIRHGIARALIQSDETLRPALKKAGFLTRDPRMKERKKPGLKRARKAPQYTKR